MRAAVPGRVYLLAVLLTLVLALAGCSVGSSYATTPLSPYPTTAATSSTAASTATTSTPATSAPACDPATATQTYAALPSLAGVNSPRIAEIKKRGYLIAGVSADTLLLGARNAQTGVIEGFDIDLVHELAKAILGDASKVQLVVITAAQRLPKLQDGSLDVVARNMTMTCTRWQSIAFSAEYYHAGQKVLVRKGMTASTLDALATAKARVCAPTGTTSMDKLASFVPKGAVAVSAATHTGCLQLFQQGQVDAITGDDTVLAGLAAQDPYAVVPAGQQAITAEPYGLGFTTGDKVFVQYANRLLEDMKADGRWKAVYDRWLAGPLGPAPTPPAAAYGRA